ncbi:hypothetical protein T36_2228 (plasmid) [Helicobacter cinaedi]|uniref:hypothetical protein n=1 Tax=Helicobacter cinaedi TaxID=213 RepID=UPI001F36B01A|nr:hypothetical protein [Helicobacter cinaedi]BDB65749.1 hypothetical protein T36_2228 [Helicobacter cinaedi]
MFMLSIFAFATFIFYLKSKFLSVNENVLSSIAYILGTSTLIVGFLVYFRDEPLQTNILYLAFIPLFIYGISYIKKKTSLTSLGIKANQQRYFKEVNAKQIYDFYQVRKDIKSNRVEVLVNKDSKKLMKNNLIVPAFFISLKNLNLTHIKTIDELEKSNLHKAVFGKIQECIKAMELKINFQEELEANNYCVEFFLMDLYERVTPSFNIGVANLEVLAKSSIEIELIGALDILNLNCVKRKGSALFYRYIEFKDRIKDYLKQEELEINPKEEVFDEEYAKDN